MSSQFKHPAETARWAKRKLEVAGDSMKSFRKGHDTWPPPVRDPREEEPPHAEVEQDGRFYWTIRILHGWMQWGPDGLPWGHFGTRAGAEAKARRLLAKYVRKYEREKQAKIEKRRIELESPEEFHRKVEHRRETVRALEELRAPVAETWDEQFDQAVQRAPRRRKSPFARRRG